MPNPNYYRKVPTIGDLRTWWGMTKGDWDRCGNISLNRDVSGFCKNVVSYSEKFTIKS